MNQHTKYFEEQYPVFEKAARDICLLVYLNETRRRLMKDTGFIDDLKRLNLKIPTIEEIDKVDLGGKFGVSF